MNETQKMSSVSRKKIISFGVGGLLSQMVYASYQVLIFYYYEVELGLSSVLVGISFIIYAVWNMINDPLIGFLTDKPFRWSKKWGMRMPWVMFGGIFLIVSYYFLFAIPDQLRDARNNPWPLFWYMVIITCLVDTFYTIYTTHYFGGVGNIFRTKEERRKGSTLIQLFSSGGAILSNGVLVPNIIAYGDIDSYAQFALVACIIMGVFLILLIPGVYENEAVKKRYLQIFEFLDTQKMKYWDFIRTTFKQRNFMAVTIAVTFYTLAAAINSSSMLYMLGDVLDATIQDLAPLMLVFFACFLISLPIWAKISKKIEHIYLLVIGIFCFGIMHTNALYARTVMELLPSVIWGGIGNGAMATAMWSIVSDTMDEVNIACGRHVEAGLIGLRNFFFRLSFVFVGVVIAGVHIATGYQPGAAEQTELAKLGVRIHTGLFPVIFDTIAAIILLKYYNLKGDNRVALMQKRKEMNL